ncbi:carboxylating nicotinate-nucleotide diphosphorylase [Legionella sp. W05-934-2]|jgi:nicotinate-nucleotide pyrophosphorylase (carboxylating)|uniref:carboxylating nicotinate-nucleotide diphosphorylase n=1 Tax=Legionella sp. W05-934-2 TaxID=1198649 RepID=UPI00346369EB
MTISIEYISQLVLNALNEDIGSGDVTAQLISKERVGKASIICREPMVVCGQAWVDACFHHCSPNIIIEWLVKEGEYITHPKALCIIEGPLAPMLTAERTALNFLQTLSATATQTKRYVDKIANTNCRVLDTRKTIPGLRLAQKYAVTIGGGLNHRFGLYDAYLIKENHIQACGSIAAAVYGAKKANPGIFIEVEVETLVQLEETLSLAVDRIMLDNFSLQDIQKAVSLRGNHPCELEVSGNIRLETIEEVARSGVDYISVGAITKSINAIDLSLRLEE